MPLGMSEVRQFLEVGDMRFPQSLPLAILEAQYLINKALFLQFGLDKDPERWEIFSTLNDFNVRAIGFNYPGHMLRINDARMAKVLQWFRDMRSAYVYIQSHWESLPPSQFTSAQSSQRSAIDRGIQVIDQNLTEFVQMQEQLGYIEIESDYLRSFREKVSGIYLALLGEEQFLKFLDLKRQATDQLQECIRIKSAEVALKFSKDMGSC